MLYTKNSHIIVIILFLLAGICFSQQPVNENDDTIVKDSSEIKPRTISLRSGKRIDSAIASDNEKTIYISDTEGSIYSYDLETLQQNWSADLGGKTVSDIISFADHLYIITSVSEPDSGNLSENSTIWEIDEMSGLTVNKIKFPGADRFYLFITDTLLVVVSADSFVSVFKKGLKKTTGNYVVRKKLVHKPVFDLTNLELFLIYKDDIVRLSIANGEEIVAGKIDLEKASVNRFVFFDSMFFIGDEKGNLYAFKQTGFQKIWRFRTGGKISDILIFGDKILAASYDNFLYCLNVSDGNIIWKKRFPGRITDLKRVSEKVFVVGTSYSSDRYLSDILSGNISDKYILPENAGNKIETITTSRLIMLVQAYVIDIYSKN